MKLAMALMICVISVACGDSVTTNADAAVVTYPDAAAVAQPDAAATGNPDAAPGNDDAAAHPDAAALKGFGEACAMSTECETMLCDRVNMGNICTAMCVNGVCPIAAAAGCNNRNVCRP